VKWWQMIWDVPGVSIEGTVSASEGFLRTWSLVFSSDRVLEKQTKQPASLRRERCSFHEPGHVQKAHGPGSQKQGGAAKGFSAEWGFFWALRFDLKGESSENKGGRTS
jgi:hypothetical protein